MAVFKNIVLTTDFSLNANAALPYAVSLARRYDGTIHLFHAIEHESLHALTSGAVIGMDAWIETKRKEYGDKTAAFAKDIRATHSVKAIGVCVPGHAVKGAVNYAKEEADIIVIATHGRTGLPHLMLGSVAERVARLSDVPVLTVRPGEPLPGKGFHFKTILLPTDFSENSAAAEPFALELANQHDGKILLVNVIDDSMYYANEATPDLMGVTAIGEWVKTVMQESKEKLFEKAERLRRYSGLHVEPIQLIGRVTEKLLELVEARHVDLIAMGTHGFTGLAHLMIGSTAEKIVQTSTVPVLSVKPHVK